MMGQSRDPFPSLRNPRLFILLEKYLEPFHKLTNALIKEKKINGQFREKDPSQR